MKDKLASFVNKKENVISVFCVLLIFACIIVFVIGHVAKKEDNKFEFTENLEKNIITITNENYGTMNINLQEFSYYISVVEGNLQAQALEFNPNDPLNYWMLKIEPLTDMRVFAKDTCTQLCINENILYMEAVNANISLTEKELEYLEDTAYEVYSHLTADQVAVTGLDYEDIYNIQKKTFLGEKYSLGLVENKTINHKNLIKSDGEYYLNTIKPNYIIEENKSLMNELVFGNITVNTSGY